MFDQAWLQRRQVRFLFALLVLLQVAYIVYQFSASFDEYVSFLIILLCCVTAYLLVRYLMIVLAEVSPHKSIVKVEDTTREEVEALTKSQQYQVHQRRIQKDEEVPQDQDKNQQLERTLEQVVQQLEQKQTQIFDD